MNEQRRIPGKPSQSREFVSPFVYGPLNRLFVPRPPIPLSIDPDRAEKVLPDKPRLTSLLPFVGIKVVPLKAASFTPEAIREKRLKRKEIKAKNERDKLVKLQKKYHISREKLPGDPFKTIIISRLPYSVTEKTIHREFDRFGAIKEIRIIKDKMTQKPRGYAFVEYQRERDARLAYSDADGLRLEGRRCLVDMERGRTISTWIPRRLGGGLGCTRAGPREACHPGKDREGLELFRKRAASLSKLQEEPASKRRPSTSTFVVSPPLEAAGKVELPTRRPRVQYDDIY